MVSNFLQWPSAKSEHQNFVKGYCSFWPLYLNRAHRAKHGSMVICRRERSASCTDQKELLSSISICLTISTFMTLTKILSCLFLFVINGAKTNFTRRRRESVQGRQPFHRLARSSNPWKAKNERRDGSLENSQPLFFKSKYNSLLRCAKAFERGARMGWRWRWNDSRGGEQHDWQI